MFANFAHIVGRLALSWKADGGLLSGRATGNKKQVEPSVPHHSGVFLLGLP